MLTAKGAVNDRVKGLKTGADDYLCKPFAMQELVARVEALLRRLPPGTAASAATPAGEGQAGGGQAASPAPSPRPAPSPVPGAGLRIGAFFFDQAGRCLRPVAGGPATDLSTTEFRLLAVLASNAGRVMSREELLDSAWGYNNETTSRTVDVHIAWLRTKLGEGDKPRHIVTVRRGGYKLVL
jgi:DNA-binding response OmpR family regulator